MDFKALVSKIASFETPAKKAETITEAAKPKIQLSEDAEIRVLAGVSTILSESKKAKPDFLDVDKDGDKKEPMKKAAKAVKEEMKVGDTKKTAKGGTVTKTKTGITHKAGPGNYGGSSDKDTDLDADDDKSKDKKKKVKEAVTLKPGVKDRPSDEEKYNAERERLSKLPKVNLKKEPVPYKVNLKKEKEVDETYGQGIYAEGKGKKPDFLDMDKDGDKKEPMKKAVADKKKGAAPKKGVNPFAKKKAVKESEDKLTFKRCLKIVVESQGSMQIDPVDKTLWTWANRVGASKFTESVKAQAFAAATYEKMGGEWDLRKTLSE
jgi:hypothetical protein